MVEKLWEDRELTERYARSFYEHISKNHRLETQGDRFEEMLEDLIHAPAKEPVSCWTQPLSRFVQK
jgi:hypothetical protein